MANPLTRHPSVKWDLVEIYDFIAKDNIPAADRVLNAIEETFSVIKCAPLAGTRYRSCVTQLSGVRMLPVKNFKTYLILYLPDETETKILYVFHSARDIRNLLREGTRQ